MGFAALGENFLLIFLVIGGLILFQFLSRGRRHQGAQREIARVLLAEVRVNQALVKAWANLNRPRNFEVIGWQSNQNKLSFLDQSLLGALSDAFTMAQDFNRQIGVAKKSKSAGYLVTFKVDQLEEPLAKSREGLEQWLQAKAGTKSPAVEYPGMFDDFLGRRK